MNCITECLAKKQIPEEIVREIILFLIPNPQNIIFVERTRTGGYNDKYNLQYQTAEYKNQPTEKVINENDYYLSRKPKKNEKYRYYISKRFVDTIEREHNDQIYSLYMYEYMSKYMGNSIEDALCELFIFGEH